MNWDGDIKEGPSGQCLVFCSGNWVDFGPTFHEYKLWHEYHRLTQIYLGNKTEENRKVLEDFLLTDHNSNPGERVMANNRMWLHHKPTGNAICLGKRMGDGWYHTGGNQTLNEFYESCHQDLDGIGTDDFILLMEDANVAPHASDDWVYDDHKPKLNK